MLKLRATIFLVLISGVFLTSCGQKKSADVSSSRGPESKLSVKTYTFAGNPINEAYDKVPKRVVAVYQSPIEILLALGLQKHIVAAAQLDTPVLPRYRKAFNRIKYYKTAPSKETVISLRPDMIFSWQSYFSDKMIGDVDTWQKQNVNTYMMQNSGVKNPNTLKNEYADILNIGKIFRVQRKAAKLVNNMRQKIVKTKKYAESRKKVSTVILEAQKNGTYRVYGKNSIGGDIATQVGAKLLADKNGTLSKEKLIKLNPDVIFSVYYGNSIDKKQARDAFNGKEFRSLRALKNKRIKPMVLSDIYATGIRTSNSIDDIASELYPHME